MKSIFFIMVTLILFFTLSEGVSHAASDRDDVRLGISQKHERVLWGKEIDHAEYLKFLTSFTGGPAGVTVYLEGLAASIVQETGVAVGTDTLFQILEGKSESTLVGGKPVYVGVATYNNWTRESYPKLDKWRLSEGVIKVPRPNTHQFYVAIGRKAVNEPDRQQLNGIYAIRTWTGKYVSANNVEPWQLHQVDNLGPGETFQIQPADGGQIAIKTWNNRWVSANNGDPFQLHQLPQQGPAERFELIPLGGDSYAIRTWTEGRRYVSANNVDPWNLHQVPRRMDGEAFHLIKLR